MSINLKPSVKLKRASLIISFGGLVIAVAAFAASGYLFLGFLGDGRTRFGVLQAFLLCFGIGAGLYLPAITVFFMARHVRGFGAKTSIGLAGILISLPLWGYGGYSLIMRLSYWPYGLTTMMIGLVLLWWSVSILRNVTRM